jgi:DNA-nicking Smr family endonuclease
VSRDERGGEAGEPLDAPETIELPITGELDLHAFAPRDVPGVLADYIEACLERRVHALRIVHGRGKGVQRAVVRRLLAAHPAVTGFEDAPPGSGGWGATLVQLTPQDPVRGGGSA